ncbi:MAG: arabinose efflux permease, partial [Cyanobacteria bacterium J06638_22]
NNAVNIALSLPLALAGVVEAALGLQVVLLMLGVVAIASGLFAGNLTRRDG